MTTLPLYDHCAHCQDSGHECPEALAGRLHVDLCEDGCNGPIVPTTCEACGQEAP